MTKIETKNIANNTHAAQTKYLIMTRKCQNHKLQTNQWYNEEETQNTDGLYTAKVKQPALSLFSSKMISQLERGPRTTPQNKDPTQTHTNNGSKNKRQ